ncbi:MAG: sterol desaturase family protein [Piscinibacter sp.]|nr:sterol desaturase family protein [Piscinibacter sp.]
MPTPLDLILDPISQIVFAMFAGLLLWERLFPGRALPRVRFWTLRAVVSFVVYFLLSSYLPLLWGEWLAPLQLFDLSGWPTWAATVVALLGYEAGAYTWHRSMHRFTPLWRSFHQMHHSAERLDALGAFWFSPLDMVTWTLLPSLVLTLLGVPAAAATATLLTVTFLGIFQHANVRTPRWLGAFVQRPEMHTVHHARGIHHYNYADLPVFDMLFGTYRNPETYEHATGFWHGASARVADMLLLRDVSRPLSEER